MQKQKTITTLILLLLFALIFMTANAGDIVLSNNSGDGNTTWYIEGEPSLVMNGFDLNPLNLTPPVIIDAVSISVQTPVPGTPIDILIYQDADGGSPVNATLAGSVQVTIDQAGVARIPLDQGIVITEPVVWIGFYLPVDFRFYADTSGSSVLTYWAWSAGGTFDVNDLSTADVLGPGDGSAPVNIDMGGIARITGEIRTATSQEVAESAPRGVQIVDETGTNLSPMKSYDYCSPLSFDTEDVAISGRGNFELFCKIDYDPGAPTTINPSNDFERRGFLYDVYAFGGYQRSPDNAEKLVVPVTHCINPQLEDLNTAVIGIAYGSPREWYILPTVRFGESICAEITHIGNISYFVPRTQPVQNSNANLAFGQDPIISPHPFVCNENSKITVDIRNNGSEPTTQNTVIRIEDILVRNGVLLEEATFNVPPVDPGETERFSFEFKIITNYDELHRTRIIIDSTNLVLETNEDDNVFVSEYLLKRGRCP